MTKHIRAALIALAATAAGPALAQGGAQFAHGPHGGPMAAMFQSLSPAGRQTVHAALKQVRDPQTGQQIRALRAQQLQLLAAPQFDAQAFARLQQQERNLSNAQHQRQQAALLSAFTQLSAADRQAFAAAGQQAEARMAQWHAQRGGAMTQPSDGQ